MHVMTLEEWKERTYISKVHIRSEKMRAIDAALKSFHKTKRLEDLDAIRAAIEAWKQAHPGDWAQSKRNRGNVIDDLYQQTLNPNKKLSGDDRILFESMLEQAQTEYRTLFTGSKLETKPLALISLGNSIRSNCSTAKSQFEVANSARKGVQGAHTVAKGAGGTSAITPHLAKAGALVTPHLSQAGQIISPHLAYAKEGIVLAAQPAIELMKASSHLMEQAVRVAYELINTLVPVQVVAELIREVLAPLIQEIAATLAPYIGMAKSGAKAVTNWAKTAVDLYRVHWTSKKSIALADGAPFEAFNALQTFIEREMAKHATTATIATIDTVARGALLAADYGAGSQAIVGACTALANLTHSIFLAGRDYYERYTTNKILATPDKIELDIFEENPLLGCYYLTSASTFSLMAVAQRNFGKVGWMGSVESQIRSHIDPLRTLATDYIDGHRFELKKDGKQFVGAFYKGGLGKLKQTATRKVVTTAKGAFVTPSKVSPERMVGIGPNGPVRRG